MRRNIYLVGFMGTGKTTIGRELARLMGRHFIDTDLEIEKELKISVKEIFEKYGEEYFRQIEVGLIQKLSRLENKVISTGGGILLNPGVKELLSQTGIIICLFTEREYLLERLSHTSKRPLLNGDNLKEIVEKLILEREEIFSKISIRLNTTNISPREASKKILDLLRTRQKVLEKLKDQYIVIE
ncbi:MAG: shikimate kinase [Armatimonadetes bacterium]|nr:shikimate kinase [Armatimonadota bacterium]